MVEVEHYEAPESLPAALAAVRGGDATVLAGGTDLMPQSRAGRLRLGRRLVNVSRVAELGGIAIADGAVRIGALTTLSEILSSPLIAEHLPVLAEAADRFASNQIRNAATIGGNVCNASPAGDTLPPLLVLDAEVELARQPNGTMELRRLPLGDFLLGPGRTARQPDELLSAIVVPLPAAGFAACFLKFGTRPALDISVVSVAAGGIRAGGRLSGVRIALGAVGPKPFRAIGGEAAMAGGAADEDAIAAAAEAAAGECTPIDDVRGSAWYRRQLVQTMTRRALSHVAQA